jgi:hypothetical protein
MLLLRLATAALALALALAAPASARHEPPEPPEPPAVVPCSKCPVEVPAIPDTVSGLMRIVGTLIAHEPLPEPPPPRDQTRDVPLAAYGDSATHCTVTLTKRARDFSGSTSCSQALTQTAQASTTGGAEVTAPLCSGVYAWCSSAGSTPGAYSTLRYRVTLTAPRGQGWAAPPTECAGAGTDRLDCTFVL